MLWGIRVGVNFTIFHIKKVGGGGSGCMIALSSYIASNAAWQQKVKSNVK